MKVFFFSKYYYEFLLIKIVLSMFPFYNQYIIGGYVMYDIPARSGYNIDCFFWGEGVNIF